MSDGLTIAVIGTGRWGARYISTLPRLEGVGAVVACDVDPAALAKVEALAPGTTCVSSIDELEALGVHAAIVATPSHTHAAVALRCIEAGLHVLVEKPLATHPAAAAEVIAAAARASRVLLPGHITLHDGGVQRLIEMVRGGAIGTPLDLHAERTSLGGLHRRESALWALGPHDLATLMSMLPASARHSSREIHVLQADESSGETMVQLELKSGPRATFRWSRTQQAVVRGTRVIGTTGELWLDEPSGKLELSRTGERTTTTTQTPGPAPLEGQCRHFLECLGGARPRPSPQLALAVVRLLATIQAAVERRTDAEHVHNADVCPSRGP